MVDAYLMLGASLVILGTAIAGTAFAFLRLQPSKPDPRELKMRLNHVRHGEAHSTHS